MAGQPKMSDLEKLWKPATRYKGSWYDTLSDEARAWIDAVAAECRKRGSYPTNWNEVHRLFCSRFPNEKPHSGTIITTVRRLADL